MKLTVIVPDSAGSKGDEAMIRGAFEVFRGCSMRLVTTDRADRSWSTELLDLCGGFEEVIVPFDDVASAVYGGTLVVLGADVIDGTCGAEASLSRLEAVRKCVSLGGRAYVFMSFRSDAPPEVIDFIRGMPADGVSWYCRDTHSKKHFEDQTGILCGMFPDFAYYCRPAEVPVYPRIMEDIERARSSGKRIIGINFCHSSFTSFHSYSLENIEDYTGSVFRAVSDVFPDSFVVMVSHDTRVWPGSWSDQMFSEYSRRFFGEDGIVLPPEIGYSELLGVIPLFDLVITGRMHLAITSIRSGVVPVMYTGNGEETGYCMVDKCRGMFTDRIGDDSLVATDVDSMVRTLRHVSEKGDEIRSVLESRNAENTVSEASAAEDIRSFMGVSGDSSFDPSVRMQLDAVRRAFRSAVDDLRIADVRADDHVSEVERKLDDIYRNIGDIWKKLTEIDGRLRAAEARPRKRR